jgi:YqjK-like protein
MKNDDLMRRRQILLERSQVLRGNFAQQAIVFKSPLGLVDLFGRGVRWLYQHPVWLLATGATLVLLRPRSAVRWGLGIQQGWEMLKWAQALIKRSGV